MERQSVNGDAIYLYKYDTLVRRPASADYWRFGGTSGIPPAPTIGAVAGRPEFRQRRLLAL
jgi:hypothetical protein